MPVRKIGVSGRSVTANFPSIKTASTHMCESILETEFCYYLEYDPLVETYEAQPAKIPFINANRKKVKYVPDFKVTYTKEGAKKKGYTFSLIEVKYQHELEESKELFELKFKAAEEYCDKAGGKFEIIHEEQIKSQRLANYKFFYRYLKPNRVPKLKIDFKALAQKLGTFNAYDWVSNIEGSDKLKGQALSNLWHMVAKGELHVDWEKPVNNRLVITAPKSQWQV